MTEEVLCARCITLPAVVDCMNCVGGQEEDALPLCDECNLLIHQGFLQNHLVRSIAIKKSICKLSDQLENFKFDKNYLQASLFEMKFIKTDVAEQEEAKVVEIHKAITEAHQSLKTFEESLAKRVRDAAKDKVLGYVACEEVIQGLIKQHEQISEDVNAALKDEATFTPLLIKEMQEKMTQFNATQFHQTYSTTLLPFTCVIDTPIDFASSIKLLQVEPASTEPLESDKSAVDQPGDKLAMFVESRMDGQSVFWASRDFTPEMTQKLDEMARKIRENLLLNATPDIKVQEGAWCCARYEDNRWYRARVEKVKPEKETVVVRWLDYAHNSELPFANLKELKEEFRTIPIQAVKCRLFEDLEEDLPYDVRWCFTGITKDKTLNCTVLKVIQDEAEFPTLLVDLLLREDPSVDIKEQLKNKISEINIKKKDPISCRDIRLAQQLVDERAKQTTPEPLEKNKRSKQTSPQDADKKKSKVQDEKPKKGSRRSSPQMFPDTETENPKKPKKGDKKKIEKKKKSLEEMQKVEAKKASDVNKEQPKSGQSSKRSSPQLWPDEELNPADENPNMNPNANVFVPRNSPPEDSDGHSFSSPESHFQPVNPPSFADVLKSKQRPNRVVHAKYPEGFDRRVNDGGIWSCPRSGGDGHCDIQYYHPHVQQVLRDINPQLQPCHPDELQTDTLMTLFGHGDGSQAHPQKVVMPERDVCKFVNPDCFPQEQSFSKSTLDAFNLGDSLCESGILIDEQDGGAVLKNIGGQLMSKFPLDFSGCQKGRSAGKDRHEPQISILKKTVQTSPVDVNTKILAGAVLDVRVVTDLNTDGTFWVVMIRNDKQQAKFISMSNELSLSSDILSSTEIHCGKIVVVSSDEGKWSRARIVKVSGESIKVLLVDTGMKADVSHDQIRKLDSKYKVYPFQALEFSIARGNFFQFGPQSQKLFHEVAFERKLKARVDGVVGCMILVTLLLNNNDNNPANNVNFQIWACELKMKNDANPGVDIPKTQERENTPASSTNTDLPCIGTMTGASMIGGPISHAPMAGGLISCATMAGRPISDAPMAGGPISCTTMAGGPISCTTMAGGPISDVPMAGGPISCGPMARGPISCAPMAGGSMSCAPMAGGPISCAPMTGGPISCAPMAGGPISCAPMAGGPISCAPMAGVPISGAPITSMADLGAIVQNPLTLMLSDAQPSPTMISTIPSTMPILQGLQSQLGFPVIPFITAAPFQEMPPTLDDAMEEKNNEPEEEWPSLNDEEPPEKLHEEKQDNIHNPVLNKVKDRKFRPKTFGDYKSNDNRSHPFYGRNSKVYRCYNCGELGHVKHYCQKFPKQNKIMSRGERKK